ncbi:MAG: methyltransferase domain-containing protein [Alphaproteobacteria bacterium]|nr:methyltransferase domain-containing protein [Alphaproteobacteria bacterium]
MTGDEAPAGTGKSDHYASYANFGEGVAAEVRREAFGEDYGQNGWQTAAELDLFLSWLDLRPSAQVLDFACGAGGPAIRIAERTGCTVTGLDLDPRAIAAADRLASQSSARQRVRFMTGDGGVRLPFDDASFDAVICIDAVNHLPDRIAMFGEWRRVLRPGGLAVFTDPAIITGPVTGRDLAIRSSIGAFLFSPPGADEDMLETCGFHLEAREDRTANMSASARGRHDARARHAVELIAIEGRDAFDRQQVFFETTARLAAEARLSRFAFLARRN